MVFNKHMKEASHYYKNFGLKCSFKYSKNIIVFNKP
jgi:hypothetical protein